MKNILQEIVDYKHTEVNKNKDIFPVKLLEESIYFKTPVISMKEYIQRDDKSGIIAEIKRQSPSKGIINANVNVEQTSIGYMQAGASALSILTDHKYFGGKNEDLLIARKFNFCPILRKDFIVDEYQIIEAKSIGADIILLIAAALTNEKCQQLAAFAHSLGLEVLLEIHSSQEFDSHFNSNIDILGVNNRNLETFKTSIEVSRNIANHIPPEIVKISESGISSPETIIELKNIGYSGFLMGESFMKTSLPQTTCAKFVKELNKLKSI